MIEDADPASFMVLDYRHAKDKNHVYWETSVVKNIDPDGYELIDTGPYGKNKKHVYYYSDREVEKADPSTFKHFSDGYYVDKENLFYDGKLVEGADVTTLEKYSSRYASRMIKDAKHLYLEGIIQKDLDASTFVIIDDDYAKDKSHVYYQSKIIEGIDPTNF